MKEIFRQNILKLAGNDPGTVLAGVSGGIDSIVLCHLLHESQIPFAIAHCNFQLRSLESDEDEIFVRDQALKYDVPFHSTRFDVESQRKESGASVQMAARDLRYRWFTALQQENNYSWIVTAHHNDDAIETFFINFSRSSGIAGLKSIPEKDEQTIRPLLLFTRKEIEEYAASQKLRYREDSSNASDKYLRNKIRHHLIPALREVFPTINGSSAATFDILRAEHTLLTHYFLELEKRLIKQTKSGFEIFISDILATAEPATVLYHLLKKFGFKAAVGDDVLKKVTTESGRQFLSAGYRLVTDREKLIIDKYPEEVFEPIEIRKNLEAFDHTEFRLTFAFSQADEAKIKNRSENTAALDPEKLTFPLELRRWQQGDVFYPTGMTGKKKLSDLFTDIKLSIPEKEKSLVLVSGGEIVWVVGRRVDRRFAAAPGTSEIYFVSVEFPLTL